MVELFLTHYFLGSIALLLCFLLGTVVMSLFKNNIENKFFRFFLSNTIGLTIVIFVYSILKTRGLTAHILLTPLILMILYKYRNNFQSFKLNAFIHNIYQFKYTLFFFTICYFYQSLYFFDFYYFEIKPLFGDNYIYGSFSNSIYHFSTENLNYAMNRYFNEYRDGIIPYHYSELYFTSFCKELVAKSAVNIYFLTTIPILISIFLIGIYSLLNNLLINKFLKIGIAFVLLFTTCLFDPFINKIDSLNYVSESTIMGVFHPKLGVLFVFILLSFILFKTNKYVSFLILLSLPVFSISFLPGVYGGFMLFFTIKFLKNRCKFSKKEWLFTLFLIGNLILTVLFFSFFKHSCFSSNHLKFKILNRLPKELFEPNVQNNLKVIISNFFIYSIPSICIYVYGVLSHLVMGLVFFLPLLFLNIKSLISNRSILYLIIAIICGALFTVLLTDGMLDNYQFYSNIMILLSIYIIFLFTQDTVVLNIKSKMFLVLVVCFCVHPVVTSKSSRVISNDLDFTFKNAILKKIKRDCDVLVFCNENDFTRHFFNSWIHKNDLEILAQYSDHLISFSIANPEIFFKKNTLKKRDESFFNNFTPVNYWKNKGKTLESFISTYKIKFIYSRNGMKLPPFILKQVKTKIKSKKTGNIFLILK